MDGLKRKLVVLLCMHRSGSSLTANILEKLGMSLGPFDLIGAEPSNPYGHFESIPFHSLNRKIQEWAFGFADDVPDSPETLTRLLDTQGAWPVGRTIPHEWLVEGERITRVLIESGRVSGFKDPRTVLVWPFWKQVFQAIEDVEIVPAALLRSPHEIAMSLCTRSKGSMPYWNAIDVVGVHLSRMKAVVDETGESAPVVRFGTPHFRHDLQTLAASCGLEWNDEVVDRVYDRSCVHHLPAIVPHPAQKILDVLSDGNWADLDPQANASRLAKDARKYESTMHRQLLDTQNQLGKTLVSLRQNEAHLAEAGKIAHEQQARAMRAEHLLGEAQTGLAEIGKAYDLTHQCLVQAEKNLANTMECLVSSQERRVQSDQLLAHTQGILAHTEHSLVETQRHLVQTQEQLTLSQSTNLQYQEYLSEFRQRQDQVESGLRQSLDEANQKLRDAQERITRIQDLTIQKDDQLRLALDREETRWLETVELRRRLERFESNAIVGAALKGRRQLKQIWLKFRHQGPDGENRTTRIDRPM